MPNKHKKTKIITKLLAKGKLNQKENVKSTLNAIIRKQQIDSEDINFDFEKTGSKRV